MTIWVPCQSYPSDTPLVDPNRALPLPLGRRASAAWSRLWVLPGVVSPHSCTRVGRFLNGFEVRDPSGDRLAECVSWVFCGYSNVINHQFWWFIAPINMVIAQVIDVTIQLFDKDRPRCGAPKACLRAARRPMHIYWELRVHMSWHSPHRWHE